MRTGKGRSKKRNPVFVFRDGKGKRYFSTRTVQGFVLFLMKAPLSSIDFHAQRGDFPAWLEKIGEKDLAERARKAIGTGSIYRDSILASIWLTPAAEFIPKKEEVE